MSTPNHTEDSISERDISSYLEILDKLRSESFNLKTNEALSNHPYLVAAKEGKLTLAQRRAFVGEQYAIQYSDACSFARLTGHENFRPQSLSGTAPPTKDASERGDGQDGKESLPDIFQFLLEGELYASKLLLDHAKSVGFDNGENDLRSYPVTGKGQAYPSYWARLALGNNRGAGAAACAVNFPAWGKMCAELSEALKTRPEYSYCDQTDSGKALAFIDFFGTPIENLDEMAAAVMMEEKVSYSDVVTEVRLLQEYEILFWDSIHNAK